MNTKIETDKDVCVLCDVETQYDKFDHVDSRHFYVDGAGQLCTNCYNDLYYEKKERL